MHVIVKNHLYLNRTTRPYAYVSLLNVMRSFPVRRFLCDSPDMSLVVLPIEGPRRKWHPCE